MGSKPWGGIGGGGPLPIGDIMSSNPSKKRNKNQLLFLPFVQRKKSLTRSWLHIRLESVRREVSWSHRSRMPMELIWRTIIHTVMRKSALKKKITN